MNGSTENTGPTFAPPPQVEQLPIEPGRTSRMGLYGLLGCGGCAVGGGVVVVLGVLLLVWFGMSIFAGQVMKDLKDNPVVVEHLGVLEELELDLMGSMSAPGSDEFVFRARGSKGRGVVTAVCVTRDADTEEVVSGELAMSTGDVFDLFPLQPLPLEETGPG